MMRKNRELWKQRIREVSNATFNEDVGRSVARVIAAEASAKTIPLLLQLASELFPRELTLPPEVSPLGSGIIWTNATALLIGLMQPFPADAVIAMRVDRQGRKDTFVLASALAIACSENSQLVDKVKMSIGTAGANLELEDVLDMLRLVGRYSDDPRIADAVALGLKFHGHRIDISPTSRIEVACALLGSGSSSADGYVELAYETIDRVLMSSTVPREKYDGGFVFAAMILQCIQAYEELHPECKADADSKHDYILNTCPKELRDDLIALARPK